MRNRLRPSNTANAIARGLVRTGRALDALTLCGDTVRLERTRGGFYWLDFNGAELRQGPTLLDAEPLQDSFRLAMARWGRGSQLAIPETRPQPAPMFRRSGRDVVFER